MIGLCVHKRMGVSTSKEGIGLIPAAALGLESGYALPETTSDHQLSSTAFLLHQHIQPDGNSLGCGGVGRGKKGRKR